MQEYIPFSCLISCYHKESPFYLSESLKSIENQTFQPDEVVLVKDGNLTDELEEVLMKYTDRLPLNVIALSENKGLGYALHVGLKKCRNKYVFRMDTDDISREDRFEKQLKFIISNPDIDILGSWALNIDENNSVIGKRIMPVEHTQIFKLIWTCPIIHPSVVFKKDAIINIGSYSKNIKRRQDYELWFRAAKEGLTFANFPDFLLNYRVDKNSQSKNNVKVACQQAFIGLNGLLKLKSTSIFAYLGVFVPMIKNLVPNFLTPYTHYIFKRMDPRKVKRFL